MSEEDKHKLSKILYYSDIHPADTEFINNIIYDLQQENKQLKELCDKYEEEHNKEFNIWLQGQKVLKDLEEWLKNKIDNFDNGVKDTILHEQMTISIIYDYIQELKEKYK